jgi:hypothetical protein
MEGLNGRFVNIFHKTNVSPFWQVYSDFEHRMPYLTFS